MGASVGSPVSAILAIKLSYCLESQLERQDSVSTEYTLTSMLKYKDAPLEYYLWDELFWPQHDSTNRLHTY